MKEYRYLEVYSTYMLDAIERGLIESLRNFGRTDHPRLLEIQADEREHLAAIQAELTKRNAAKVV